MQVLECPKDNSCEDKSKLNSLGESSEGNNDFNILREFENHFVSLKPQFPKAYIKEVARILRFSFEILTSNPYKS